MVLFPRGLCCRSCPLDDSDGEGTYFETDLKSSSIETPSRWLARFVSFGPNGLAFSTGYAGRCTYIDLTRDCEIEIQVTAATAAQTFSIFIDGIAFASDPYSGVGMYLRCQHNPPTLVGLQEVYGYIYVGDVTDPGTTNVTYVAKFKYVSGAWSASFSVGGVVAFSDQAAPLFSLPNSVFYHGVQGTNEAKLLSRYYMKLTYTSPP